MLVETNCLRCETELKIPSSQLLRACPKCRKMAERIVLAFVAKKSWRWEAIIIRAALTKLEDFNYSNVEDLLFLLVKAGKLEWFGAEEAKTRPDRRPTQFEGMLKYRIPKK